MSIRENQVKLDSKLCDIDIDLNNFRQHEDHETDPVTPGDDGAFVVDEEAGSDNNSSVVTRSSSARQVVGQMFLVSLALQHIM